MQHGAGGAERYNTPGCLIYTMTMIASIGLKYCLACMQSGLATKDTLWRSLKSPLVELSGHALTDPGETNGLKTGTMKISNGPYPFGWLKKETGVHRLVRISKHASPVFLFCTALKTCSQRGTPHLLQFLSLRKWMTQYI